VRLGDVIDDVLPGMEAFPSRVGAARFVGGTRLRGSHVSLFWIIEACVGGWYHGLFVIRQMKCHLDYVFVEPCLTL